MNPRPVHARTMRLSNAPLKICDVTMTPGMEQGERRMVGRNIRKEAKKLKLK